MKQMKKMNSSNNNKFNQYSKPNEISQKKNVFYQNKSNQPMQSQLIIKYKPDLKDLEKYKV